MIVADFRILFHLVLYFELLFSILTVYSLLTDAVLSSFFVRETEKDRTLFIPDSFYRSDSHCPVSGCQSGE